MIFREDSGPGRRVGVGMVVCDEGCLGVVQTFSLLSCDEST